LTNVVGIHFGRWYADGVKLAEAFFGDSIDHEGTGVSSVIARTRSIIIWAAFDTGSFRRVVVVVTRIVAVHDGCNVGLYCARVYKNGLCWLCLLVCCLLFADLRLLIDMRFANDVENSLKL